MMTVDTLLCFCFFLSLQVTGAPAADAEKQMRGAAGEDFSGACGVSFSGAWKIFCRENCEGGNILIKTRANAAKTGRYSIEYVKDSGSDVYVLWVKISELNRSDSGRYRCGLGQSLSSVSYQEFTLVVPEASTSSPSSSDSAHLTSTPAESLGLHYSSGSLAPSASSESTNQSVVSQEEVPSSQELLLVVALTLTVSGILLSGALLVLCRRRCQKHLKGAKTPGGSERTDQQNADYDHSPSGDLIYMNAKPVCRNKK